VTNTQRLMQRVEDLEAENAKLLAVVAAVCMPFESPSKETVGMLRGLAALATGEIESAWYYGIADALEKMMEASDG